MRQHLIPSLTVATTFNTVAAADRAIRAKRRVSRVPEPQRHLGQLCLVEGNAEAGGLRELDFRWPDSSRAAAAR